MRKPSFGYQPLELTHIPNHMSSTTHQPAHPIATSISPIHPFPTSIVDRPGRRNRRYWDLFHLNAFHKHTEFLFLVYLLPHFSFHSIIPVRRSQRLSCCLKQ